MIDQNDDNDFRNFIASLSKDTKEELPVAIRRAAFLPEIYMAAGKSAVHNTDVFPCYWFYKPITQPYKKFEDE